MDRTTTEDGKYISRAFTPITKPEEKGKVDLLVKFYKNGAFSHILEKIQPGNSIEIAVVPSTYKYKKGLYNHIILIAGGTGITPLIHV